MCSEQLPLAVATNIKVYFPIRRLKAFKNTHADKTWILTNFTFQGADPDGEDPDGNKLMNTTSNEKIKSMLKNV